MKILIGAGSQTHPGWISTQKQTLNLLDRSTFEQFFETRKAAAFVCEHVWEHLTEQQGRDAAKLCYDFLTEGGFMRVAVPDANFRNESYQNMVKVGGPGPLDHPAADHKIVYDLPLLTDVFASVGFGVDPLEYCDNNGRFHYHDWCWEDGPIFRSFRTDARNRNNTLGFVSLIIDARKV
ncbi:MAG: hypothetical protein KDK74_02105 [Cephaloticoccus sp.]|nr:hypothetical protein [Cephaloticoccus sp.]